MDVLLQIVVPELTLIKGLEHRQKVFSWEGVEYPQGPPTYHWGDHVKLIPGELQPFVQGLFPKDYIGRDWVTFAVEGDALYLWESEISGFEVDWHEKRLDDLLVALLTRHKQWGIVFELYADQIDSVYQMGLEECIQKIEMNLRRDVRREGFIAYY